MLSIDSLVIDLIFKANAEVTPEVLVEGLGGEDILTSRLPIDPDREDPRFEMEVSPSMPFRRRGERRLLLVDPSVAPMREDPAADPIVPIDLRPEKERLINACATGVVRFGRLFALGSWGDAVWVAENAVDLRGIALIAWALDPTVDVDGKKRASRLSQEKFQEKLLAYEKRLEELDEKAILDNLGPANFARHGDLIVVDVLENDGTWDQRKSLALEMRMAAIDQFSLIPGAPKSAGADGSEEPAKETAKTAKETAASEPEPEPAGPPLGCAELADDLVLIFPKERFDLDVAAALGKGDWDAILRTTDGLSGQQRDHVFRRGAEFIAPLEFLSEVFVDGVPLTKPRFEEAAQEVAGARTMEVHFPRFGPVLLFDLGKGARFVCSHRSDPASIVPLLPMA